MKIFEIEKFIINDNKTKNYEIILDLYLIKLFKLCQDKN